MAFFSVNDSVAFNAQMAGYLICDSDDTGAVKYYGFEDVEGRWYILKEDTSVSPKTYRLTKGNSGYSTNFTNRASLTYGYPSVIFK